MNFTQSKLSMFVSIVKILWVGLCLLVLFFTLIHFGTPEDSGDLDLFFYWSMVMLSFPAGFLGGYLSFGIVFVGYKMFPWFEPKNHFLSILTWVFVWFSFFIPGYFQWFKLIPYVFLKLQKKRLEARKEKVLR